MRQLGSHPDDGACLSNTVWCAQLPPSENVHPANQIVELAKQEQVQAIVLSALTNGPD